MYSIVRYDSKPVLTDPWFVEALPGIGNVGKIAGDFLADTLGAKRFAVMYSENFPPQVIPDQDCVIRMACNELWYAKAPNGKDVIFLRGDYQGSTPEGQFMLAEDVMEILLSYGTEKIITLGGYGTGQMTGEPHVFGAVSRISLKKNLEKMGVTFNPGQPQAGIIGAAGALIGLGQLNGIDSFCLMGETSGFFADHKAAIAVINVLKKIFKIRKADMKDLQAMSKQIDELTAQVSQAQEQPSDDDSLSYIG
ncbi:conserved hypothetical protein TIGR00162 [Thermoplasmatales archaeon BRNA1]|nr:conserved hypothetical protein TIGR00162 [Thermoplasmatales archaeon BRNA1]